MTTPVRARKEESIGASPLLDPSGLVRLLPGEEGGSKLHGAFVHYLKLDYVRFPSHDR